MKILLIPKSIEEITATDDLVNGYILALEEMSVNFPKYFKIEEVERIIQSTKKDIFVALNKNIHNNELKKLEEILLRLDKYNNIKGIFYYDIALVNLKQRLKLKNDLVWSQEHLTTNATTCNFWYKEGVKYTYLSSDITLNEIIEIRNETKMKLIVNIFGYVPIFTSKRHLISNYLKTFRLNNKSIKYYLSKEGKEYPIVDEHNTTIYSNNILNVVEEFGLLEENNIEYGIVNSFNINTDVIITILKLFKNLNKNNIDEINQKIKELLSNVDNGFLEKETIYKVIK